MNNPLPVQKEAFHFAGFNTLPGQLHGGGWGGTFLVINFHPKQNGISNGRG